MAKPATQRPNLPSVGRLGLVEPSAPTDLDQLGWNSDAHIELLWSLSRSPDADVALRTMVRLADAAKDSNELNQTLVKDKGLRGRLFGVLGSSLALGDHLVANPQSWHLLAGDVTLPSADELRTMFTEAVESASGPSDMLPVLRAVDQLSPVAGRLEVHEGAAARDRDHRRGSAVGADRRLSRPLRQGDRTKVRQVTRVANLARRRSPGPCRPGGDGPHAG